jgi:hypothetical protein
LHRKTTDLSDEVNRAGGDDESVRRGDGAGLGECIGEIRCGVRGNVEGAGSGEKLFKSRGARVVDWSEEDVIVRAVGAGVEEREKDLRHLFEVLVAKTAEDQRAGLRLRELGDRGTKCPGPGRVVGYVKEETGAFGEGYKFETPGPFGVAYTLFDRGIRDFVTFIVTF